MNCRDYDVLVSLRATGALEPGEAERLEAHLAMCPSCRAQADEIGAALSLAALPPLSETERRVFHDLPERSLGAVRRTLRRRSLARRALVLASAVAAAAAVVLAPAVVRRDGGGTSAPQVVAWSPDLDTIWNDTSVVDVESSAVAEGGDAAQGADDTDAAVAVLEI